MKKITLLLFLAFCFASNAQVLTEGFEAGIPAGWTQTQIAGATDWTTAANNQNSTVQPRTGASMAYFYVGNYVDRTRLETPALDVTTVTTPVLTFYYTNATWGGDIEELRVFVKSAAADAWTQVAEYTSNAETWTEVNIVLPNPSNDYYIAFEAKANWGRGATIDDILVDELSGCLPPGSLNAAATSVTDADLSWTGAGSETDWTYEYGITGYVQGNDQIGGASVMTETASITGLTSGVVYDFYVQANCGGSNGDSTYTGPYTWTQPDTGEACGTAIVATLEADCGTATPLSLDFSTTTTSGGGSCDTFNNIGFWVTTTTDASGELRVNASAAVDMVLYSACGDSDIECFADGIAPSIDLVLTPSTQYYMYFWQEAGSTAVVDICMSLPPVCTEPTGLIATPTGETTVDLSWTASISSPIGYNYEIQPQGSPQGTPGGISGTEATTMVGVSGLVSEANYDAFIQANCDTDGTSFWVGPVSFSTPGPSPANDNCADAENIMPSTTGAEVWITGTTLYNTDSGEVTDTDVTCGSFGSGRDVWYQVEVPAAGDITIETRASAGSSLTDTTISVFSGTCGAMAGTEIECDDDGGTNAFSLISLTGQTPGAILYVRVQEYEAAAARGPQDGPFEISAHATEPALSTQDFDFGSAFTYYPNPVDNILTLNSGKEINNVAVYNMLGQEVVRATPNTVNTEVNMSNLQPGAYFVKVTVDNTTKTIKVIKK